MLTSPFLIRLRSAEALSWWLPAVVFPLFAITVFLAQGSQPPIAPDHVSYMGEANFIIQSQPDGNYWAQWNSVNSLPVLLAYFLPYTGSHVLSLKVILAANTVLFLWAFFGFMGLFSRKPFHRVLFSCMAAMSVSFGVTSWGLTDSAALLGRSLAFPWIVVCLWLYFQNYDSWWKFVVFPLLVLVSLLHLGSFHVIGALVALELLDWIFLRRGRFTFRLPMLALSLLCSFALLVGLESTGKSVNLIKGVILWQLSPPGAIASEPSTTTRAAPPPKFTLRGKINPLAARRALVNEPTKIQREPDYIPAVAWASELSMRAWRNMPIPWVNVANILSSAALILALAFLGYLNRREEPDQLDTVMALFAVSIIAVSLLPQTGMWILRNLRPIYPINFEEIRTLSWIMVPCLYFTYRLFEQGSHLWLRFAPSTRNRALLCAAFLALPLTMKSLTPNIRNKILLAGEFVRIVDEKNPATVENARQALGIAHQYSFYYDTLAVRQWLEAHLNKDDLLLTEQDELLLSDFSIVGTRQQAVLANPQDNPSELMSLCLATQQAISSHDLSRVIKVASGVGATHALVPWPVANSIYSDGKFSVIAIPHQPARRQCAR